MAVGVVLDVIARRAVQLFHVPTLVDIPYCLEKADSAALAVFQLHLEFFLLPIRKKEKVKNRF
jgi:hypothetical protein